MILLIVTGLTCFALGAALGGLLASARISTAFDAGYETARQHFTQPPTARTAPTVLISPRPSCIPPRQ